MVRLGNNLLRHPAPVLAELGKTLEFKMLKDYFNKNP